MDKELREIKERIYKQNENMNKEKVYKESNRNFRAEKYNN